VEILTFIQVTATYLGYLGRNFFIKEVCENFFCKNIYFPKKLDKPFGGCVDGVDELLLAQVLNQVGCCFGKKSAFNAISFG
jgi:hypothetical protein